MPLCSNSTCYPDVATTYYADRKAHLPQRPPQMLSGFHNTSARASPSDLDPIRVGKQHRDITRHHLPGKPKSEHKHEIMSGDCAGIRSLIRSKKQGKQDRRLKAQRQQDVQRQTNPNGLLEIALKRPFSRNSFTAADPGRFYKGHGHAASEDPWKAGEGAVGARN